MFEDFISRRGREIQLETCWPRFLLDSYLYLHVIEIKHCYQLQWATLINIACWQASVGLLKTSMNPKYWSSWCLKPSPGRWLKTVIIEPCLPRSQSLMSLRRQMVWILIIWIQANRSLNEADLCPGHWQYGSVSNWFFTQPGIKPSQNFRQIKTVHRFQLSFASRFTSGKPTWFW